MNKKRVAVLFGGVSSEHEVSCMSAASVLRNIPEENYDVLRVGIDKSGDWFLYSGPIEAIADAGWAKHPENRPAFIAPGLSPKGLTVRSGDSYEQLPLDAVFPVLHGKNGEDGTMQGLLQLAGLPFVGCDATSSAACMDKVLTNVMLDAMDIPQAKYVWFYDYEYQKDPDAALRRVEEALGRYPVFVKPANAGSSVGVSKATDAASLKRAIEIAVREDSKILIEEGIDGQEVECAVFGGKEPVASIVGEIAPSNEFYDYEAKYISGSSGLYIPARIEEPVSNRIRETAVRAFQAMGCFGLARVDFFVRRGTGEVLLNELNTLPGFTSISMYPKLMEASGLAYPELIDRLIALAIRRAEESK